MGSASRTEGTKRAPESPVDVGVHFPRRETHAASVELQPSQHFALSPENDDVDAAERKSAQPDGYCG